MMRQGLLLAAAATLASCSSIPRAGPSSSALSKSDQVEHVQVTPELAASLASAIIADRSSDRERTVATLAASAPAFSPFVFAPGDRLSVTLWSYLVSGGAGAATNPQPSELGRFLVADDGTIVLPYVGSFRIAGMELTEAQRSITGRIAGLGVFRRPSALIAVEAAPRSAILVTGAIGSPREVPWRPGGRTLSDALTEALGANPDFLREDGDGRGRALAEVAVVRGSAEPVSLPMELALTRSIPLKPGDRLVVSKRPAVVVNLLGAMRQNSQLGFAEAPTLTHALARASGLDPNLAARAVFVMRERPADRPLLYDFAWNRAEGMIAANRFLLVDNDVIYNDVIYVAEAPIVSIQKVVNTLFQLVLPAQLAK